MNRLASDLEAIVTATPNLWDELRGQQILLTGGTGFFGCWLVESFCHVNLVHRLKAGITVLTRDADAFAKKCPHLVSDPAVSLHAGDVRTFDFPVGEFRFVIHAATEASAKQASEAPLEMLSTIVAGTERTLRVRFSVRSNESFLLTSSGAVYGKQPPTVTHVPETFAGAPDPLGLAASMARERDRQNCCVRFIGNRLGFDCKIARCWAFCGPHLPLDSTFRDRQLHWRRSGGKAHSHSGRWNPEKILFICRGSGDLALDGVVSGAGARAHQCRVSA